MQPSGEPSWTCGFWVGLGSKPKTSNLAGNNKEHVLLLAPDNSEDMRHAHATFECVQLSPSCFLLTEPPPRQILCPAATEGWGCWCLFCSPCATGLGSTLNPKP